MDGSKNISTVDLGPTTSICFYCKERFYYEKGHELYRQIDAENYGLAHLEECRINKQYWNLIIREI